MKFKLFFIALVVLISSCEAFLKQAVPVPEVIRSEHIPEYFGNGSFKIVVRNDGSKGDVIITVTHGEDIYEKKVFFEKEEVKTITVELTGNSNSDEVFAELIAASLKDLADDAKEREEKRKKEVVGRIVDKAINHMREDLENGELDWSVPDNDNFEEDALSNSNDEITWGNSTSFSESGDMDDRNKKLEKWFNNSWSNLEIYPKGTYSMNHIMYVSAVNGLKLRTNPSLNAVILDTIPYQSQIDISRTSINDSETVIGMMHGAWVEIKWNGQIGYVFDSYLSKFKGLEIDENLHIRVDSQIEKFTKSLNTTFVDTFNYIDPADPYESKYNYSESIQKFDNGFALLEKKGYEYSRFKLMFPKSIRFAEFLAFLEGLTFMDDVMKKEFTKSISKSHARDLFFDCTNSKSLELNYESSPSISGGYGRYCGMEIGTEYGRYYLSISCGY